MKNQILKCLSVNFWLLVTADKRLLPNPNQKSPIITTCQPMEHSIESSIVETRETERCFTALVCVILSMKTMKILWTKSVSKSRERIS